MLFKEVRPGFGERVDNSLILNVTMQFLKTFSNEYTMIRLEPYMIQSIFNLEP